MFTLEKLFDVFCNDKIKRKKFEEIHGVVMQDEDFAFLESMRGDRRAYCQGIDKKYHETKGRKEEMEKRKVECESAHFDVSCEILDAEDLMEEEDSTVKIDIDDEEYRDEDGDKNRSFKSQPGTPISTRSSSNLMGEENGSADRPVHVRTSERLLNNDIVHAFAELDGHGLSYMDSLVAMKVVANRVFKQDWKLPKEKDRLSKYDQYDDGDEGAECDDGVELVAEDDYLDTLPTRKAIRNNLKKMEAYSLNLDANEILNTKDENVLVTHATDSTTRKRVGSFAPQGIHINRDRYLPLPTLCLSSETTTILLIVSKQISTYLQLQVTHPQKSYMIVLTCT